jgi:hypothetical protein
MDIITNIKTNIVMKTTKNIDDILNELYTHPEYIGGIIYTWTTYLEAMDEEESIKISELSNELKETLIERAESLIDIICEHGEELPDLRRNNQTGEIEII